MPADFTGYLSFAKQFPLLASFPGNAMNLGLLGSMPIVVGMRKITICSPLKLWVFSKEAGVQTISIHIVGTIYK
jgi:hypothetical protein